MAHGRGPTAKLDELADESRVDVALGDLTSSTFVSRLFETHPTDVLVNNAGSYPVQLLLETSADE